MLYGMGVLAMSTLSRVAFVLVLASAALMVLPGTALLGGAHSSGVVGPAEVPTSTPAAHPSVAAVPTSTATAAQAGILRLKSSLGADHVPAQEQLLPSLNPGVTAQNGVVTPIAGGAATQPTPMGVADYGIAEKNGKNVGSISYTPSVKGVLNLNDIDLLYLDSVGPDEFSAQLNSVLTDVTVHNTTGLQFWTQNVFYYYQSSHTLHLLDAIVNFSSSAFNFPAGTIIGGDGYLDPGFGYFDPYGPAIYAPEPFSTAFYMNSSIVNNHPAIYFNYSVTSPAGTSAGSFDMVEFNSTVASPPHPTYQIDGKALGDTGYIPNDVELILGGDGGGSTTTALNISGSMNLYTQPNGTSSYLPVPAAYDFGGETGETIEGVAEWASGGSNPTVHFGPGPSMQGPLWGVLGAPAFGKTIITLQVNPASAFVFASMGSTFDANASHWGYVPESGTATFGLPPGTYSFQVLLSDHNPWTLNHVTGGTHSVTLSSNPSLGVYTPLWAFGNAELASISAHGGTGSVRNPYVLDSGPAVLLSPLFGEYNDYMFPVFSGILLAHTSLYVTISDETQFEVPFTLAGELSYSNVLPLSNELSYGFYRADNVSIVDNPAIGGWINYAVYGQANIVMWNSSDNLIAGNTFPVASLGVIMFGGTGNTLWGNVLTEALPIAPDPGYILNYGNPVALDLYESGDLIYNNYFGTPQTAFTPAYNPYDFYYVPHIWTDRWNVASQPSTDVRVVNGWKLAGNILGLSFEGGNYWSNYGTASDPYGVLPYNNGGNIVSGGDHIPLVTVALYAVSFTEMGLPHGTSWSVTLNGITQSTTKTSMTFWDPDGTYAYVVGKVAGHTATPASGAAVVNGAALTITISWS
jgi:thermopsin